MIGNSQYTVVLYPPDKFVIMNFSILKSKYVNEMMEMD